MRTRSSEAYIRLPNARRKVTSKRVRFPWRERQRRQRIRLSRAQKEELKRQRDEKKEKITNALLDARTAMWEFAVKMHEDFPSHSARYYYRAIMQRPRLRETPRKISLWNAFVSQELKKHNSALGSAERKRVSSEVIKEISARWKAMTPEERQNAVGDHVEELEQRRENHKHGVHNVPINACNDTRATLSAVANELENLHGRTGADALMIVVRSDPESYNRPYIFYTSERIAQFVVTATGNKETLSKFAMRLEAACIGGIDEVVRSRKDELMDMKKKTKMLINQKLEEACERGAVNKMFYTNFDSHITRKYGIVLEGWPSDVKFAAPGHINSIPELQTLHTAWETGRARFRLLSNSEWRDWILQYDRKHNPDAMVSDPEDDEDSARSGEGAPTSSSASSVLPVTSTSSTGPGSSALPLSLTPTPTSFALPSSPAPAPSPAVAVPPSPAVLPPVAPSPSPAGMMLTTTSSMSGPSAQPPPPSHGQSPSPAPLSSVQTVSTEAAPGPSTGVTRKRPRSNTIQFFNAVTMDDGTGIIIPKRQRKERSDKNTKRGPRKKRVAQNENEDENAPSPAS